LSDLFASLDELDSVHPTRNPSLDAKENERSLDDKTIRLTPPNLTTSSSPLSSSDPPLVTPSLPSASPNTPSPPFTTDAAQHSPDFHSPLDFRKDEGDSPLDAKELPELPTAKESITPAVDAWDQAESALTHDEAVTERRVNLQPSPNVSINVPQAQAVSDPNNFNNWVEIQSLHLEPRATFAGVDSFIFSSGGRRAVMYYSPRHLVGYDLDANRKLWTRTIQYIYYVFSPDGSLMATVEMSEENVVAVFVINSLTGRNVRTCGPVFKSGDWDQSPRKLVFTSNQHLRVIYTNGIIQTFNVADGSSIGEPVKLLDVPHPTDKTGITFNPRGGLVAIPFSSSPEPYIAISDLGTGLRIGTLFHPEVEGYVLTFSEDSTLLAANLRNNKGIAVWEVATTSFKTVIILPDRLPSPGRDIHIMFSGHFLLYANVSRSDVEVGCLDCDGHLPPNSTNAVKKIPVSHPKSFSTVKACLFGEPSDLKLAVLGHKKKLLKDGEREMYIFKPVPR
jgi:hypothetical protein